MKNLLFGIALILFGIALILARPTVESLIGMICAVIGLTLAGVECFRNDYHAFISQARATLKEDASKDKESK